MTGRRTSRRTTRLFTTILGATLAGFVLATVPMGPAAAATGTVAVTIKTPAGVPGTVKLRKNAVTKVASKAPAGTTTTVRLKVATGRWTVSPQQVLTSTGLYIGTASKAKVRVYGGRTANVTITYKPAPSVRNLTVTRLDRFGVGLSWTAPSSDAQYAVRQLVGDTAPTTATSGTAVPVSGTTATAAVEAATQYSFSVFARRPGTTKWWGPVSTTVTTPGLDPTGATAAAVVDPATVLSTDPGDIPVSVTNGVLRAGVPAGETPALGQPWVLPASPDLPGGFVGKVKTISSDGLSVTLEPAGLADAFDYFDVSAPDLRDLAFAELANAPQQRIAARRVGVACGGSLEQSVTIDPDLDPFGSFSATLKKQEITFAPDIPVGVSFDASMGVDLSVSSDISVAAGANCQIDMPAIIATLPMGPVPLVYMVDPQVSAGVYGEVGIQNLGFTARLAADFAGRLAIGEEDFFEGDITATAQPLKPTVTKAEGGLNLYAGATATVGPGLATQVAGAVAGVSANLTPLDATITGAGGPGCLQLDAESSASISVEAKAWLGSWDFSRTVTIPGLEASNPYPGSPWNLPSGCAGDGEYRITEGTLDVSHSWSGGCSNGEGWCDVGSEYTRSHQFQETSSAQLRVSEPGEWSSQWSNDQPAFIEAPMQFTGWQFNASSRWRDSGYGCTWTSDWTTQGPVQFASSPWASGLRVSPAPDFGLDAKAADHYWYDDGLGDQWSDGWWGSLGAWDTDYSNGYPRVPSRSSWSNSGGGCSSDSGHYDDYQALEWLHPGIFVGSPEQARRSSRQSTSTPIGECTPEACSWRVDGTDTYEFRSTITDNYGYQGSGTATVTYSYVVERR